jgi:hypothetical protein
MIFKGLNFRKTKRVVDLPREFWRNETDVAFGRVCSKKEKDAIKTRYDWKEGCSPFIGESSYTEKPSPVYAKIIEPKGYSLTNMMYGKDGKTYLMLDGQFYVRTTKRK